jgi:hypothetical protein
MAQRGRPTKWTEKQNVILELYKKQSIDKKTNKITEGFVIVTREEFIEWFEKSNYDQGCCYCGTTNETSKKIYDSQTISKIRPDATRGEKRMHRLELERIDPKEPYDNLKNLAWACHWCNNAKSNFFTEEEFHPTISLAIKNVIDKISKKIDELTNK